MIETETKAEAARDASRTAADNAFDTAGQEAWTALSTSDRKRELYADDSCFRTGWEAFVNGADGGDRTLLRRISTVTFKPDALVTRSVATGLERLRAAGYRVLSAHPTRLTPARAQWVWRFQWNRATIDRLRLALYFLDRGPSIVVALAAPATTGAEPATAQLARCKGSADHFAPDSLRGVMGMRNRLLSLVHTPDEPADLVRDVGAMFDRHDAIGFWRDVARRCAAGEDGEDEAGQLCADLADALVRHELDPAAVAVRRGLEGLMALAEPVPLATVEQRFGPIASERDAWDFICLAADRIAHMRSGVAPLLESHASGADRPER